MSPDGRRIAVLVGSSGSGDVSIYDTHSTAFTRFTFDGTNTSPLWSRDSKSLYYASVKASGDETVLRRRPIDGSRDAEALGALSARGYLDAIDPLEKHAFFNQYDAMNRAGVFVDIVRLPIGGGTQASIVAGGNGAQYASALSPDGRWLAYQSDEGGRYDVYVRDLTGAGGRWQVSTTGGEEPHWSIDGKEIFYRNDTRFMTATVTTSPEFRSDPPAVLFDGVYNLRSDTGVSYDVHPKGDRFLMVRLTEENVTSALVVVMNWFADLQRSMTKP